MSSSDLADMGVSAERAIRTILGGESQPSADERMDAATFAQFIQDAPDEPDTYDDTARLAAKWILEHLRTHPEDAALSIEGKYGFPDGTIESVVELEPSLYDKVKATHPRISELDLTGFMVGWAANAARTVLALPPQRNPAILEVEVADDAEGAAPSHD